MGPRHQDGVGNRLFPIREPWEPEYPGRILDGRVRAEQRRQVRDERRNRSRVGSLRERPKQVCAVPGRMGHAWRGQSGIRRRLPGVARVHAVKVRPHHEAAGAVVIRPPAFLAARENADEDVHPLSIQGFQASNCVIRALAVVQKDTGAPRSRFKGMQRSSIRSSGCQATAAYCASDLAASALSLSSSHGPPCSCLHPVHFRRKRLDRVHSWPVHLVLRRAGVEHHIKAAARNENAFAYAKMGEAPATISARTVAGLTPRTRAASLTL